MERDSGSGALVFPPEMCISYRSHSQGDQCKRWFQHLRPVATRRDRPAQEDWAAPLIPCHHPAFPGRHSSVEAFRLRAPLYSEALCAGPVLDEVLQPDARGARSRTATPARKRDRDQQKDMLLDPRGMRRVPGRPGTGRRSGVSGTRLAAATFAGPLYYLGVRDSGWARIAVTALLHAF